MVNLLAGHTGRRDILRPFLAEVSHPATGQQTAVGMHRRCSGHDPSGQAIRSQDDAGIAEQRPRKGKVIPAGWSGMIKTFSQMTMIHFLLYLGWTVSSNWFITAGAVWVGLITLWSGVEYFLDNRDILRAP